MFFLVRFEILSTDADFRTDVIACPGSVSQIKTSTGSKIGYKTPIQHDMMIHLRYTHQVELLKEIPLIGKGFNMAYRVQFVIDIMKQQTTLEYYDHKTAKFAPEDLN